MPHRIAFVVVLTLLTVRCAKTSDKSHADSGADPATDAADSSNTDQSTGTDTQTAGTVALEFDAATTPAASLGIVQASLESVPETSTGQVLVNTVAITTSLALGSGYQDENCDGNAYPIAHEGETKDGDSDTLAITAQSWSARHFYCLLKVGTSPETMIGSITISRGVMCALERAGALAPEKDGIEQKLDVTVDTTCFTKEFVEAMANEQGGKLTGDPQTISVVTTVKKLANDPHWDLEIVLDSGDGPSVYRFRSVKDTLSGMRLDDVGGDESSGYTYSIAAAGVVRFENRLIGGDPNDENAPGFTGKKHIRLLVEGSLDKTTYKFTDLTRVEGVSADYHGDATLASIKGNATDGIFVHGQTCQGGACDQLTNFHVAVNGCTEVAKCQENSGIPIASAEDFKFSLNGYAQPSDVTTMGEFLSKAQLPLSYDAVTLKDLP